MGGPLGLGAENAEPGHGGHLQRVQGQVLEDQETFDLARAAGKSAPGLNTLQGAVLEVALLDLAALELGQRRPHALVADLQPHREHVDEEAHHRLDALHLGGPAGDDAAEDHVVAAGGAGEDSTPGSLEQGVESELVAPGQGR